ncbi:MULTISPECIES: PAS domain-containing sensor histidine kinase [unclassified Polaromonas]|uniref:PAS domain-containing sensor histidine kinase n=1 Tax=unclassified Polaromonas TaxID=2638319 RepID=UPI0018CA9F13|nr:MULTISPECIES: PAS domain-containing sensor histidine kinase [unclassified Polaromonas]MBG6073510.1 signal transduction histidine kinase [Polaromonas sp. CG_9.7]MBG6115444.1 signal transduction histidine kinase [Polaromonas sp. CG_9.2]
MPRIGNLPSAREQQGSLESFNDVRQQETLLKAGALQDAIFNSANFSSIATDEKGVIQIFNVGAERMLGYAAGDVVNQVTPADISDSKELVTRAVTLSGEFDTPITPGFEALVFKASRGIEDIYELTYIRKDGSRFPAVVSVTALRDDQALIIGYLLIGTDNTARKQAEEALLEAGALQNAIFNSANFSSIATDEKGVIQIFNVGAERMLGYSAGEVLNQITPADISDPQEVIVRAEALSVELGTPITPGFEALVFKASRGIEDIYELTYIRKDGSRFPAIVSVTALRDAQEAIIGYLLIGTDNTARKEVEAAQVALDQRTTELLRTEHALRQSQKLEALGQLTGGVAHDFNNLLAVISSSVELLRSDKLPVERRGQYLDRIFDTVGRAAKLTSQLLAFARQQPLSPEVFNVDQHVQGVIDLVRPLMGAQVQIHLEPCGAEDSCFAEADINQFETALVNLALNARDAMNGNGQLTIKVKKVDNVPAGSGRDLRPGDFVAISVTDTGCGIAAENLEAIFEPFYTTKEVGKGTGLGLSQVFGFARQSGGEVKVRSEVDSGSVFTLFLARAEHADTPEAVAAAAENSIESRSISVLVVEDNEILAQMTCEILNILDYQTTWAANATAALGLLTEDASRFDPFRYTQLRQNSPQERFEGKRWAGQALNLRR